MLAKPVLAFFALCGLVAAARADESIAPTPATTPSANLPMLALDPQGGPQAAPQSGNPQQPSPWSGLTVGTEISGVFGKGIRGGFGGAGYVGYNHEFANNVVVGVQAVAGYAPGLFKFGPKGYDYAGTNITVGYDLGRFEPYVTMGAALAKPTSLGNRGFSSAGDSLNDLFESNGGVKSLTNVGAGFNYAFSNNFSMGLEVNVVQSHGFFAPSPIP